MNTATLTSISEHRSPLYGTVYGLICRTATGAAARTLTEAAPTPRDSVRRWAIGQATAAALAATTSSTRKT